MRKADYCDVEMIMNLMNSVDSPYYFKDDESYVINHIEKNGFILIEEDNRLDAFLIVHYEEYDDDVKLSHIAHMDSVVVHPSKRGQSIMKKLIQEAERLLCHDYHYFMATVHPDNIYSHRVLEDLDYHKVKTVYRYQNNKRDLMLKTKTSCLR